VTDVGYVAAGWGITAVVLAGYYARLVVRTRRASRSGTSQ
jgi:hypothetical protein